MRTFRRVTPHAESLITLARRAAVLVLAAAVLMPPAPAVAQQGAAVATTTVDTKRFDAVGPLVEQAIREKKMPGAVVVIGQRDAVVFERAFGNRALVPAVEPMTIDTVFDAASLTKVVATTTAVMMLVEQGRLRLADRVASHIPGFERYGKGDITIRHLLVHTSGLRPDLDLNEEWQGAATAITRAIEEVPTSTPDARFVYSDINFFVLAHIVATVSGEPFERFVRERIFAPLGMVDTMYLPPDALKPRIAPTEPCTPLGWPCAGPNQAMLRGVVHDPTARRMGGVAGHAGMFTTARDLARFARMLLNGGTLDGVRILAPMTVQRMITPSTPPGMRQLRGLGWDIDTSYSSNRGDLFPLGSFGHTGFTGTSLWIDPASQTFVVLMSNRVHPDGKGDAGPLRSRIATIAASAVPGGAPQPAAHAIAAGSQLAPAGDVAAGAPRVVMSGLDVLRAEGFARLEGKRVGLVTNHTGLARDGAAGIDLFFAHKDLSLVALFSPEHGIRGIVDAEVPSARDEKTGLLIHSLYGETRRPTEAMLQGIDTMVIDLQDIGARFYTYMTTMAYVMEECAKRNITVVVLDRPNPVNGWQIEGPVLDADLTGFVGYASSMPTRHGITMGELARLFNAERKIGASLEVVAMRGYTRSDWFDETGLPWVNFSPNMRNLHQAALYPGIGGIEFSNISVGRGTDTPFEQIGAPFIKGTQLADALNARKLPGIRFYPVSFTPASSVHAGTRCEGVFMVITGREALRPVRVGLEIAAALMRLYPDDYKLQRTAMLFGSASALARVGAGEDPAAVAASWATGEAQWRLVRSKYLLY